MINKILYVSNHITFKYLTAYTTQHLHNHYTGGNGNAFFA